MLGPVFVADLRSNSRRPRLIVLRTLLVVLLLLFFWLAYQALFENSASYRFIARRGGVIVNPFYGQPVSMATQLADFGSRFAYFFILVQFLFILFVGPAYVAGAIAEEKQRGTLEYLLATDLSGFEIVVGKYCSRLCLLLHFVLIAVPVLAITLLVGGVSVELITAMLLASIGCAASLTAVALWVSVMSRKGRDALIRTYMILIGAVIVWFIFYELRNSIHFMASIRGTYGELFFEHVYPALGYLNPVHLAATLRDEMVVRGDIQGLPMRYFGTCFLGHAALALLFVLLTTWTLRRRYLRQVEKQAKRAKWVRAYQKPPIRGGNPLFWKERNVDDGSWRLFGWFSHLFRGLSKTTFRLVILAIVSIVVVSVVVFLIDAVSEGSDLTWWLTWVTIAVFSFSLLAAAVRTASSIAVEKDRQTWDALLASPLPTPKLLQCRLYGGFLSARWLYFLSLALLLVFVLQSPRVFLTALTLGFASAGYLWFSITLAGYYSLASASSIRNVLTTLTVLIMLNAFPLLVVSTFGTRGQGIDELFILMTHPATSVLIVMAGLLSIVCVVLYYKVPSARWLIAVVKWIGYLLMINTSLFVLLAGLTFTFRGLVGMFQLSLLVSPLGIYGWTVFEHLPSRQYLYYDGSSGAEILIFGSGFAYLLFGSLILVLGQYRLRRTCGRIDHSKKKSGKPSANLEASLMTPRKIRRDSTVTSRPGV